MIKNLLTNIFILLALSLYGQGEIKPYSVGSRPAGGNPSINNRSELKPDTTLVLKNLNDSTVVPQVKAAKDSVAKPVLESEITYSAKDSIIPDFENQKMYLYKDAVINYQNIELKANYIVLDLVKKEVYAEGLPDSTGAVAGTPVFKDGDEQFEAKTMRYNFETQKGIISDVKTTQGDGFVQSGLTKKIGKDVFLMEKGRYTTCNAEHPHFYLRMTRAKVISNKKIITGPAYMVLEDFPIYFPMIPFGYFPNSTTYTSGILIPTYGEEQTRGFFLRDGGYYWAANEYFDLALRGDIYSKGSWATKLHTNYKVRYKFSGSFDFSYNLNKYSEKPLPDAHTTKGFSLTWSHSQDPKANPNRTFSASVNLSTSSYDKENSYVNNTMSIQNYLQTQKSSSISYTKKFENSPFNLSVNLRHSQNSRDTTISLSLPELTFNMSKINPFRSKNRIGPAKWWEQISISYSGNIRNSISNVKENELLKKSILKDWQNGWRHSIPITLPSFNLMKYITVSPSFNYSERWYTSYINERYDPNAKYLPPRANHVVTDTVYKFRRNYDYSYSIATSTTIYGTYAMSNPNWKLKAIRHKITPSLSFSYTPDFGQKKFGFWGSYTDGSGKEVYYNHFQGAVFGSAGRGESGSISFNLNNNLEAKVLEAAATDSLASKDNKPKFNKVRLLDVNMSTSYNMIADSMKLAPFALTARTTIKGINVNMNANLDPYMVDSKGKRYDEYVWNHLNGLQKLGRLTNASLSFGMNFDSKKNDKKAAPEGKSPDAKEKAAADKEAEETGYAPFDMPWSFRFDYSFYYNKTYDINGNAKKTINQSLNMSGQLTLTDKWHMNMNTNFDVQALKFSFTTFSVTRSLHCWSMSFNFVPFGARKSYSFTLAASSAMLRDLKVQKQSSWRDN